MDGLSGRPEFRWRLCERGGYQSSGVNVDQGFPRLKGCMGYNVPSPLGRVSTRGTLGLGTDKNVCPTNEPPPYPPPEYRGREKCQTLATFGLNTVL